MIWQCALGGVGGACGEKNLKNALKVIFRGTILGVFFFIFSLHRGGGQGGVDKCQTFFFFLKASLSWGVKGKKGYNIQTEDVHCLLQTYKHFKKLKHFHFSVI